jgi:hypothetical protein
MQWVAKSQRGDLDLSAHFCCCREALSGVMCERAIEDRAQFDVCEPRDFGAR